MPLPTSASDVTETVKNAAQANGSIAQAARAATGAPVRASRNVVISSRPASAIASIVKSSAVARSLGFAPPLSSGPSGPRVPIVAAHTGAKSLITVSGDNYDLYTFLNTGNNTFVVSDGNITADIFVLGGGGGSSGRYGGGGGAGGIQVSSNVTIPPGTYTVTVGAGGSGAAVGVDGSDGGNSTIVVSGVSYTGFGGGGGARDAAVGRNGGCGGGGVTGGIGSQGFNGARANMGNAGGGGGGMGSAGFNRDGGNGKAYDFTGTSVVYAGGGAAQTGTESANGTGGTGGGGTAQGSSVSTGENGTDGLGGGAAGGFATGGRGGSGRVMIRVRK